MIQKSRYIYLVVFHLLFELLLTLISSIDWKLLVICLIIYLSVILKEKDVSDLLSIHYLSSLIFVIFHYLCFTLSYAEIIPWETGIVIVLIILIAYYIRNLTILTTKSYISCLPFGKSEQQENDFCVKFLMIKFLLTNICLFMYTLHLCMTTICTPSMYFNWFLVINNCEYTYSALHSSYTLSGGILVSLSWTFISVYYLIIYRFR